MNLLIALFLILTEAISEGLRNRGRKDIAGVIELLYRAAITLIVFAWFLGNVFVFEYRTDNYFVTIIGYVLLRFALFDIAYNLTIGEVINHIGTTKFYDKLLRKVHPVMLILVRLICLLIGVAFLMGWRHGI